MQEELPLVTIYIPTFNRRDILERAIDSVLSQSYQNLEIIIVDDCSTDATCEYLEGLAAADSRVIYLRNPTNKGACHSRNWAIEAASGRFITGLDDDDYFMPDRIQEFVTHWQHKRPDTVALSSYYRHALPGEVREDPPGQTSLSMKDLYLRNLAGSQVFTETRTLADLGGFDTRLEAWQDYELWLRLLTSGQIEKVPSHSYVVDKSHPYERISNTRYDKILRACELVISKYELTGHDALRVKSQLLIYRWTVASSLKFLLLFALRLDIPGVKAVIMRTIRAWKKQPH